MTQQERAQKLEIYSTAYDQVQAALASVPADAIHFKPGPDKWSIHEIVIHLADSEAHAFIRCRTAIAEPNAPINVYDQDAWASRLNYSRLSFHGALELFRCMRDMTMEMLRLQPESSWQLAYSHPERGAVTLEGWLQTYSNHVVKHIGQIKRNVEAWNASSK